MRFQIGSIVFDTDSYSVFQEGKVIRLTHLEFDLIQYLYHHADNICSRDEILNAVWGQCFQYDTGTLDVHIHSIRKKLQFKRNYPIESIRGVGIILHTKKNEEVHILNIQDFAVEWIKRHQSDFSEKQLTPHLRLDPFVREITISPDALGTMLDGILHVLLPFAKPGVIHIKSKLGYHHFSLSLDINDTINELRIPLS